MPNFANTIFEKMLKHHQNHQSIRQLPFSKRKVGRLGIPFTLKRWRAKGLYKTYLQALKLLSRM